MTICKFFANSLPRSEIEVPVIKFLSSFHGNSMAFGNDSSVPFDIYIYNRFIV